MLEDEFLSEIRALANQMTPLKTLRISRNNAFTRANFVSDDMPIWLLRYFGQVISEISREDDMKGAIRGDITEEKGSDEVNDLVIRLTFDICWPYITTC